MKRGIDNMAKKTVSKTVKGAKAQQQIKNGKGVDIMSKNVKAVDVKEMVEQAKENVVGEKPNYTIQKNKFGALSVIFDGKPEYKLIALMKKRGFRYYSVDKSWSTFYYSEEDIKALIEYVYSTEDAPKCPKKKTVAQLNEMREKAGLEPLKDKKTKSTKAKTATKTKSATKAKTEPKNEIVSQKQSNNAIAREIKKIAKSSKPSLANLINNDKKQYLTNSFYAIEFASPFKALDNVNIVESDTGKRIKNVLECMKTETQEAKTSELYEICKNAIKEAKEKKEKTAIIEYMNCKLNADYVKSTLEMAFYNQEKINVGFKAQKTVNNLYIESANNNRATICGIKE